MKDRKPQRENTRTTLSLAPLWVDDALAALLKTPQPLSEKKEPKQPTKKAKRWRRRGRIVLRAPFSESQS